MIGSMAWGRGWTVNLQRRAVVAPAGPVGNTREGEALRLSGP
jgi:hypothetical protein